MDAAAYQPAFEISPRTHWLALAAFVVVLLAAIIIAPRHKGNA